MKLKLIIIILGLFLFSGCVIKINEPIDVVINSSSDNIVRTLEQDTTNPIFSLYLTTPISEFELLTDLQVGQNLFNISTSIAPVIGNRICLKYGTEATQPKITAVTSLGANLYQVRIDSVLDFAYPITSNCFIGDDNLGNYDGSVNPVYFSVSPSGLDNGTFWDIEHISCHFLDSSVMGDDLFGSIPALTNGIVFRNTNGITKNFANMKSLGDFADIGFDLFYSDKVPAGKYSTIVDLQIMEVFGAIPRVTSYGDTGDKFTIIIQDDLTDINDLHCIVNLHLGKY